MARALGVEDRLGSIEAGKLADLYVVRGNPLADIKATRIVVLVIKDGKVYRSGELLSQVRDRIGPSGPDDRDNWELKVKLLKSHE